MVRILDLILIVLSLGIFAALSVHKLVLMYRYRNDPDKLRAIGSVEGGQFLPKRIKRFVFDEPANTPGKPSIPSLRIK